MESVAPSSIGSNHCMAIGCSSPNWFPMKWSWNGPGKTAGKATYQLVEKTIGKMEVFLKKNTNLVEKTQQSHLPTGPPHIWMAFPGPSQWPLHRPSCNSSSRSPSFGRKGWSPATSCQAELLTVKVCMSTQSRLSCQKCSPSCSYH